MTNIKSNTPGFQSGHTIVAYLVLFSLIPIAGIPAYEFLRSSIVNRVAYDASTLGYNTITIQSGHSNQQEPLSSAIGKSDAGPDQSVSNSGTNIPTQPFLTVQ